MPKPRGMGDRIPRAETRRERRSRRTVRDFSARPVEREIIEECPLAAGTAPSGANLQPWHLVVISDPGVKHELRVAAEAEEEEFYRHRAPREWLDAIAALGTDASKPFLLLVVGYPADGARVPVLTRKPLAGIASFVGATIRTCAGAATTGPSHAATADSLDVSPLQSSRTRWPRRSNSSRRASSPGGRRRVPAELTDIYPRAMTRKRNVCTGVTSTRMSAWPRSVGGC